jgi:chlorobactene glucosyltransferase
MTIAVLANFLAVLRRMAWNPPALVLSGRGPSLSVIIPARDEEQDLRCSLESVLSQAGVELEVIVVNDHSRDRTGAIADAVASADPRVKVIHDPELPPGWLGKCNAMQQAAARATGELLLFSDADILHQPGCLQTALTELERERLDFLSFFPRMEFVSLWENIVLPAMVAGLAELVRPGIHDPQSPEAMGAGAFLLVRSAVFRTVGGFEPIKHEIADDVSLARLVKRHGFRVAFHAGPRLIHVRLFKGNRHAFWGMTKNILLAFEGRLWLAPMYLVLPLFVDWMPVYGAIAGLVESNIALFAAATFTYALQYALLWSSRDLFSFHRGKALFFPLVVVPLICCMLRALYLHFCRGAVHWRGRTIRVRDRRSKSCSV